MALENRDVQSTLVRQFAEPCADRCCEAGEPGFRADLSDIRDAGVFEECDEPLLQGLRAAVQTSARMRDQKGDEQYLRRQLQTKGQSRLPPVVLAKDRRRSCESYLYAILRAHEENRLAARSQPADSLCPVCIA